MERSRFLLSGSGGQGVITMAILLAEAAALHEGRIAVQSQSYGPEARGGATCLVPLSNGICYSQLGREDLWAICSMLAPERLRKCVERYKIVKKA